MENLIIRIDGASRGNPGAAGIGVVISNPKGSVLKEISEYIGETTNNVAEYTALIRGLQEAVQLGATRIRIFTDSQLLAYQVCGSYKVKAQHLKKLNEVACGLMAAFRDASISHVPREQNADADKLASEAARSRKSNQRVAEIAPEPEIADGQQTLSF